MQLLAFSVVVVVVVVIVDDDVFFFDLMLVGWQNGRIAVGRAMAWQFLCCYRCCCYGGCCCLLLLGIMCWWHGRMAVWLWAVPWLGSFLAVQDACFPIVYEHVHIHTC